MKYLDSTRPVLLRGEQPPLQIEGDLLRLDTTDFDRVPYERVRELCAFAGLPFFVMQAHSCCRPAHALTGQYQRRGVCSPRRRQENGLRLPNIIHTVTHADTRQKQTPPEMFAAVFRRFLDDSVFRSVYHE